MKIIVLLSRHDLSLKVFEFLKDWGTDRNLFSITLDNVSWNVTCKM